MNIEELDNLVWNKGYSAYFDGLSRNQNPYEEDLIDFDDWENGWDQADSDCDDE